MKRPYLLLLGTAVVAVAVFVILSSLRLKRDFRFVRTAEEMHKQLVLEDHYIHPEAVKKMLDARDAQDVFVDLRDPNAFADFHLEGSVNIPMKTILDRENLRFFRARGTKVLVDDNSIDANQVWLLLSQYGIGDLLVLEGGLNYWKLYQKEGAEALNNRQFDDEKPKFEYEELVKDATSGSSEDTASDSALPPPPAQRRERKSVQGGCS